MKKKPRHPTAGRPELPPALRRVPLNVRVPPHVKAGLEARARAHGCDSRGVARSSVGLEVERAFDQSQA